MNITNQNRLRKIGLILLGATAIFNLLGGFGTTCAAFFTSTFDSMAVINDYRIFYQLFVIITVALGFALFKVKKSFSTGESNSLKKILIILLLGTLVGGVHMFMSQVLRGQASPANIKFYINLITLIYFLFLSLPKFREVLAFPPENQKEEVKKREGISQMTIAIIILTVYHWTGTTHIVPEGNWIDALKIPILVSGVAFFIIGFIRYFHIKRFNLNPFTISEDRIE